MKETVNFYVKSVFVKIDFRFWWNSKTNERIYMKFLLVVYIRIIYTRVSLKFCRKLI